MPALTALHWAHMVGYGPFFLCVIHKEGLCPSSGDINSLMMIICSSELLKHEFSMYVKLWPSIAPIAGVWVSLNDLLKKNHPKWIKGKINSTADLA
jgi:hypothetical protein